MRDTILQLFYISCLREVVCSPSALFILPAGRDMRLSWWLSGKESACNAGDMVLIPGLGRSPGGGNGNPGQYSCWDNLMDRGALGPRVGGIAELDMTEWPRMHDMMHDAGTWTLGDPSRTLQMRATPQRMLEGTWAFKVLLEQRLLETWLDSLHKLYWAYKTSFTYRKRNPTCH